MRKPLMVRVERHDGDDIVINMEKVEYIVISENETKVTVVFGNSSQLVKMNPDLKAAIELCRITE